jgi:hypothetical protein
MHTLKNTPNFDFIQIAKFNGARRGLMVKLASFALLLTIILAAYLRSVDGILRHSLRGKTVRLCVAGPKEPGMYAWVEGSLFYRGAFVIPDCASPTFAVTVSILMDERGTEWQASIVARDRTAAITDLVHESPNNFLTVKKFTDKIADRIAKML